MAFSEFLNSRREAAKALVEALRSHFEYVSVLGVDIKSKSVRVNRNTSNILPGRDTECGFVVKMSNGGVVFEYSTDDIPADVKALAETGLGLKEACAATLQELLDLDAEGQPLMYFRTLGIL